MGEGNPGGMPAEALACDEPLGNGPLILREEVGREEVDQIRDVLGSSSYSEVSNTFMKICRRCVLWMAYISILLDICKRERIRATSTDLRMSLVTALLPSTVCVGINEPLAMVALVLRGGTMYA